MTKFIIKKCECIHRKSVHYIKCPCPKTQTIRKNCIKGDRKVITIFYVRHDKKCKSKRKFHEEICEKSPKWTPKYACQCYHYGAGNILTFDRRRLLASTKGKCSMLMSKWVNVKSDCSFKFFSITEKGKFVGQMIYFKDNRYLLSSRKQLFINGKSTIVPHSEKHLRIFFSGEYLQFVSPHCNLAIAYNGHGGGYISVGVFKGHKFKGLCGNCNGNPIDDKMKKEFTGGKKCQTLSGFKNMSICMKKYTNKISHQYCGRLSGDIRSHFLKCKSMAFHFLHGCIKDVCSEWPNKEKMQVAACKVHSMAAEACSEKNIFFHWRSAKYCPMKCTKNKIFVATMNPCPKTCENHFFETSRRCFRLPHRNGCDCKPGFVLDGNECVNPTRCRCLDKMCIDRFSKSRCEKWKNDGKCTRFPKLMAEFCRVTCKFCKAICEDQVSSRVCNKVKVKGKCTMDFYKQMCRLTCFPESCKCPECQTEMSKCHPIYKYKIKKTVCFKLNRHGTCIPFISRLYEKCGVCPKNIIHTRTKCDFCKGYRYSISTTYFRDQSHKVRCKSTSSKMKEPCICRSERGSFIKCIDNNKLVKTSYQYGNSKCQKCVKITTKKVIKISECRGTWISKGHCNRHRRTKFVTFHKSIASNCKCSYSSRKIEILCKCPNVKSKKPVCEDNHWVFYQIGYTMEDQKKCKKIITKSLKAIKCKKSRKVTIKCNHKTCESFKYLESWRSDNCQCHLSVKKSSNGKCCCPKTKISRSMCLGYYILKKKIVNMLLNGKCIVKIFQKKLRCRCPHRKMIRYCNKHKGHIVRGYIKFSLTKYHTCKKRTMKRASPVLCRKVHVKRVTPCAFYKRNRKEKYRKIIFITLVRHGCQCIEKKKSYLEPCGCKHKKRHQTISCPKECKNLKHCPHECVKIKKWFIYKFDKSRKSKKCVQHLYKIEKKKCCCKKHIKKIQRCVKGKYIETRISKKVLIHGKCSFEHKEINIKVNCPVGFITKVFGPKRKGFKQKITNIYGRISNCHCKTNRKKKFCPWHCSKTVVKMFCDKSTKSIVKKVFYEVLRGCKCIKKMKIVRRKIFCPKYVRKVKSYCKKHSHMGVRIFTKAYQNGCKCKKQQLRKPKLCKCKKMRMTKPVCKGKFFIKRKLFYKLMHEKCKKHHKLIKIPIRCSRKVKILPKCYRNSGKFVKYKIFTILKQCKCLLRKKIIQRGDCHCKHKRGKKIVKCDPRINQWIHISIAYFLNRKTKKCSPKKIKRRRPVYCHQSKTKRERCNLVSNKRKYIKIFYKRQKCHCVKRKKVFYQRCGCPKTKPKIRKFCDKIKGHFITLTLYKKWKEAANKCIKIVNKKVKPIYCQYGIRVYKSKCNGKFYNEKLVKKYKNNKTCSCKTRIRQKKRNCHCPTKIIKKKCIKETGYVGKKIVIFKKWDSKRKKCHISNRKVFYHRCKCPKSIARKKCFKGKWIHKSTHFKLHHKKCIKSTRLKKYRIYCKKLTKKIIGKCNKNKCMKKIQYYSQYIDKKQCRCVWKKSIIRKCKCCGCPKKTIKTHCYKDKYFKTKILFFISKEGKCSYKCHPKQRIIKRKFKCKIQLPSPYWTKCDKSECQKRLIKWKIVVKHCKCIKRKVLGKRKTCCCPYKPRRKTKCRNGKIVTIEKHIRLRNHKCKPWFKKFHKQIKCKKSSKKFTKKCSRSNCKQPVFIKFLTLDHKTCKCKKRVKFLYKQPCCCRKKSNNQKYCTGKCYIRKRQTYSFNTHKKTCVKKTRISKSCIKCPKQQKISGTCKRKTCLKKTYHYQFFVRKCKCIKRVIKSSKVCCCPKPTPWSKICKKHHFVYKKRYYKLKHGKCVKRIKIRKEKVNCRSGSIKKVKHFKCNKRTCMKKSIIFKRSQNGCKCGLKKSRSYKKCCCPPPTHKIVCKNDKNVVKFTKTWHLRNNKCKIHKQSFLKEKLRLCKNKKWIGKCDRETKKRILKFIIYKPKHCKCSPAKTVIQKLLCLCPKPVRRMKKCNKHTCIKSSIFIYFIGPINHKKCVRKVKKNSWKCCCLGKLKWSQTKCDRKSGDREIYLYRKTFDHKTKSCKINRKIKILETRCPKTMRTKMNKCEKFKKFKISIKFGWKKDRKKCKCKRYSVKKRILCSCKHKGCKIHNPKCIHGGFLEKKKICFMKKKHKCLPIVKMLRKKITCPHKHQINHKCSRTTCIGKKIIKLFFVKHCKCITKTKIERYTCCCPKSRKSIKCRKDSFEIIHTRYRFNKNNKSCKKLVVKKSKIIKCQQKRTRSMKCDKMSCNKIKHFKIYKVIHCKCQLEKMQKLKRKCCCPKNKSQLKCYEKYGVMQHVQYKYRLYKGTCIVQKLVEQDKISCNRTKFLRSKCNKRTKKRTIKIISYKRIGCKCKKIIRITKTLCACKKPKIVHGKCIHKKQSVYLIEYILKTTKHSKRCVKTKIILHTDPCVCPKIRKTKKCKYNQIQIRSIQYNLQKRKGRKSCHMKDIIRYKKIHCPHKQHLKTKCKNFKYKLITVFYQLKFCKCMKKKTIKEQACQCHKRNKHYTYCADGVIFNVKENYFSTKGLPHCLMHSVFKSKSINCQKNKRTSPLSRKCNIKRNYSYFKDYLVTWNKQIGCKCKKMSKKITKLCRCSKNIKKIKCIADDTLKIYQMTVTRVGKHCLPKQEITTRDIQCTGKERDVKYYPCAKHGKHKCFQIIRVTEKWVENCKCRMKSINVIRRCCVPKSIKIHFCDKKRGENVQKKLTFKLSLGKIIYHKDDFMIQDKKLIKSINFQKQKVVCPSRSVIENCNKKSGIWIRKIISFKRIGCHCKRFVRKIKGKCHCPENRKISSKCINEFQTIRKIKYQLIDRHCVRFSQVTKQRCSCPQKVRRIYCDGEGRWVKCLTEFNFNKGSHTCSLEKRCIRWDQVCPDSYRLNGKCNKQTYKRKNRDISFVLNDDKCKCEKSEEYHLEYCSCKHRNLKTVKCIDGVHVIMKTIYSLQKGQCLSTRIKIKKKIECHHTKKRLMKCNKNRHSKKAGYQLVKLITFHNEHCKCIKRIRSYYQPCDCKLLHHPIKKTFCKNHHTLMSQIFYRVLIGKKCMKRTKYFKKDIICSDKEKVKVTKCKQSRTSKISYKSYKIYHQITKDCKCLWKLKRQFKKICKCPPKKKSTYCKKNHIILKTTTIYAKHKSNKKCMKRYLVKKINIRCPKKWKSIKCKKSSCTLYIKYYSQRAIDCKCITQRKMVRAKCCCPKPTKKKTICVAKKHTLITSWHTFKLMDKHCVTKKRFSSFRVRCERRQPRVRMGKCVQHHRTVYIITKQNRGCKCVNIIKKFKERCKCPKKVIFHKGKCTGKFANDKWSALKFLKKSKKCKRKIIENRTRRCKCPTKKKIVKCVNKDTIIRINTKYILHKKTNSCKRMVSRFRHHIGCTKRPQLINNWESKCSKHTGYYKTCKKTYKIAKHCKCKTFTRTSVWPCNCLKLYPTKKTVKCVEGKYLVYILKQYHNINKQCIPKLSKSTKIIKCHGEKKKIGKCNQRTKRKIILIFRKKIHNCHCKWALVKRINLLCSCPKPATTIKCIKGKFFLKTKTIFHLRNHKCIIQHIQMNYKIKCNVGVRIKISKCDPFSGYKTIKKIMKSISKCQCFSQISKKKCRCRCPKPLKYTTCIPRTGHLKTTKVIHKLIKCKCISNRNVSKLKIKCPKSKVLVTSCKITNKQHDKYKSIIKIIYHRNGCKCQKQIKRIKVLCSCSPKIKTYRKCVKHKYKMISITKRIKSHGKCKRVEIDNDKLEIDCLDNRKKKNCNKKTGIETIMIIRWHLKDCKCFSKKSFKTRKCKCKSQYKLVRTLKCNKKCFKIKLFKYEILNNYHCVKKYIAKRKKCCCPKHIKTKSRCLQKIGMIQTTKKYWKLSHGKCITKYAEKKRKIHCPKRKSKKIHKLPKGLIKIIMSHTVRVGCKCKIRRKIIFRKWNCQKSSKSTKCVDAPESSKETVTVKYRMMTKTAGCKKLIVVHREPTECEPDRTFWTKCKRGKHGNYKTLIQISYSAKNCKCHKSVEKTPTLCKCEKSKIKKLCDKSKGLQIQIFTHFLPDSRTHKHCVPVVTRQQFKVLCDKHFKFSHKTKCSKKTSTIQIIYQAERQTGCGCKKIWRTKHCRCKCPKPKIYRKCRHDNVKEKIITKWILIKCMCKKLVNSHLESIKCPEKTKSYLKCGGKDGKCIRRIIITTYQSHHCQCKKFQKIILKKCCCPKSRKMKKCSNGHWITKFLSYKLKNGRCYKFSNRKSQNIVCSVESIIRMTGPCLGKKQKYKMTKFIRKGCKCVKVFKTFFKHCLCLKKSAAEVIFLVDQTISIRRPKYQKLIEKLLKDTVSVFPVGKTDYRFALVKYSEKPSIVFNLNEQHEHHTILTYIKKLPYIGRTSNLAKALHLTRTKIIRHSRPGVLRLIYIISDGVNDRNIKAAFREIILLQKMHVRLNAVAIKPTQEGSRFLKGLMIGPKSHIWRLHKKKHFKLLPQKILRTICKKACPIAKIKHTRCSKETGCRGKTYIYGYKFIGKRCLRKIITKSWLCCCLKKSKLFKTCKKNRILLIKMDWIFKHKSCVKDISKRDISGKLFKMCKPKLERRVGHCKTSNYRIITIIRRSVKHCKCIKLIKKQKKICRCLKSKRMKMCKNDKYRVDIKLYETFKNHKCIKRRNMFKKPIICSKTKIMKSKCNRMTCTKRIQIVKFFPKNCQCHHKSKVRYVKCCCSHKSHSRKFCKSNRKFYKKSFFIFNKKRKTCIKKTITKSRKTECNTIPKIRYGKCSIPKGKVWYLIKQKTWSIIKNCKCLKMMKQFKLPCRCKQGPILKQCIKNHLWKRFAIRYKLVMIQRKTKVTGICKKQIKILDITKNECDKNYQRHYGKCKTRHSTAAKYRSIRISWNIQRNCKCKKIFKHEKELCKCPRGVTKTKCIKNKYLVKFHSWFTIIGHKNKSKCVLKTKKMSKKINCPKPQVIRSKCKTKYQEYEIVKSILHISRKCKCSRKVYVKKIKCHFHPKGNPHGSICEDNLPIKICNKVKQIGGCQKNKLYRNKLCKMTCGQCSKCPKNSKIGFKIKYHSCLVADRHYDRKLHLKTFKRISYHDCMMKCKKSSYCKSFDFYIKKKKGPGYCVLNKINLIQLRAQMLYHRTNVGASYSDLKRHQASHCILSVKICKNICPAPVVKKLGKCKCLKLKKHLRCHRKSNIYYYIINHNGRCLKRSWKGLIPCHVDGCNNWKSDKKCKQLKLKGKCSNKIVRKLCKTTCTKCKCSNSKHYITKCDKNNHRTKITIVKFKHPKHGKCVMHISKEKKSCNVCYKKPFKVVHKCKNSVRYISTIQSVKLKNGNCKIISSNKVFSCSKCPRHDQHFVTSCNKSGFLKLITKYSIRKKGCCRFKIESRKFWCHKCPQRKVRKTKCSEGYRLRHVFYYVRSSDYQHDKSNHKCKRRIYTKKEKCKSYHECQDELSELDCRLFKKSKSCHRNKADAYKLCRATCGLC